MAKSLRSKWKRKMRAEKRVRYGEREVQKLKKMLTEAGDYQMIKDGDDVKMTNEEEHKIPINSLPRPRSQSSIRRLERSKTTRKSRLDEYVDDGDETGKDAEMTSSTQEEDGQVDSLSKPSEEMAVDAVERVYSKRSFKDQFGNYPVWMNKRKIITQRKKNKRIKKNRAKSVVRVGKRNK